MDIVTFTKQMQANANRIRELVTAVSQEDARWKPTPDAWSILEVIHHLYDEEKEDFRMRLNIILNHPGQTWPPTSPGEWVTTRKYNEQDLTTTLNNFMAERKRSVAWLQTLENPDWNKTYTASFGTIRAGDIFISWVTHDLLHLRQLIELHCALTLTKFTPYKNDYAK